MSAPTGLGPAMGIAVSSSRLAYSIIGEDDFILDYAIWDFRYHDRRLLWPGIKKLIEQFRPSVACTQKLADPECQLGERARSIVSQIEVNLAKVGVPNRVISKSEVRVSLGIDRKATKQEVAECLAILHPDLARLAPVKRKEWEAEHRNMILFMAVGLAMVGR